MRRLFIVSVLIAGCGASTSATSPATSAEEGPADVCWRAHLPVEPCDSPLHEELVGLWGHSANDSTGPSFRSELVYDGCHVTISFECPYVGDGLSSTMEEMVSRATFNGEAEQRRARGIAEHDHHGTIHRTHALWRDDVLVSVSEVSIELELARIRRTADGALTLEQRARDGRGVVLTRYRDHLPLDGLGRQLLCPPEVVRRPGEWRLGS
jgi:hypothetical protein